MPFTVRTLGQCVAQRYAALARSWLRPPLRQALPATCFIQHDEQPSDGSSVSQYAEWQGGLHNRLTNMAGT